MQKMIVAAVMLLVAQIGLLLAVNMGGRGMQAGIPETPFLEFSPDAVRSLEITDGAGKNLLLEKEDAGWMDPAHSSVPADTDRIMDILNKLAALKQGFVVAASPEAARRFKVDADSFEKHVVLRGKDQPLADFFLGTSPAFRQIHARRADSKDISTVNLGSFELESGVDKWLDKSLAKINEEDLAEIIFRNFSLKKTDDGWQPEGLTENANLDKKSVDDIVNKARNLTVQGVFEPATAAALLEQPVLRFTVVRKDGRRVEYLFARENEDFAVLKLSDRNFYLKVRTSAVEALRELTREGLREVVDEASRGDDDLPLKQ